MPWADKLYGCDPKWWETYDGVPAFKGEKWSTHENESDGVGHTNSKDDIADDFELNLVRGRAGAGFSFDPSIIHYGSNSGFQALNMAILLASDYIVMVGYDMRHIGNKGHFFGEHPAPLFNQDNYEKWVPIFDKAAETMRDDVTIINATPKSAIRCFPMMELDEAIANYSLHRNRPVADIAAN